jgi:hypothetical protein
VESDRALVKARLIQIEWDDKGKATEKGPSLTVQFNPATLKVSYANQVQSNDQSQSAAKQYVGRGSSKLSLELIFDVSMPFDGGQSGQGPTDVRQITEKVFGFMKPAEEKGEKDTTRFVAPGVRLRWGTFLFDGIVESMDESLELWSEEGVPLRATVSLSMSQQGVVFLREPAPAGAPATPGTQPLAPARSGESLQRLAGRLGLEANWKAIARANGIANPRRLAPGQMINLSISTKGGRP